MKIIPPLLGLVTSMILVQGNEDHLVLVPTPITNVGDGGEHTIIEVPYISGYGVDFEGYCGRIFSPYLVDVHSPSSTGKKIDINHLSDSGIKIDVRESDDGNVQIVTLNYAATENPRDHLKFLKIITKCVYQFGDNCFGDFKVKIILKGIADDSVLHEELAKIQAERKLSQDKHK